MVRTRNHKSSNPDGNLPSTVVILSVAMFGFFSGTLLTLHSGLGLCEPSNNLASNAVGGRELSMDAQVEQLALARIKELQQALPECKRTTSQNDNDNNNDIKRGGMGSSDKPMEMPVTTKRWLNGIGRTNKRDFHKLLDTGVPLDLPKAEDSDVVILYGNPKTLPDNWDSFKNPIPPLQTEEALQNCEYVNIILTNQDKRRNQCLAIMPQYESYHIQKWMRLTDHPAPKKNYGGTDKAYPLIPVSRAMSPNGHGQFVPPSSKTIQKNWDTLATYFANYKSSLDELRPLASKVATKSGKTITVMVCNFGQSELLANFVCSARSRNFDISSVLVFATDPETKELAEALGLTAFYDERNFGDMPSEAAGYYGDSKFTMMMMAKVICVQMISALGYNILFQDVDIVWFKDPIEYFENNLQEFDMMFQDDGGHTVRYAPYSANSGFYYVRHNAKTEYFFSSLLMAGDIILETDSHQQALIALMSEHVSLYNTRIKVFSRDEEEFPGGYHYHQVTGKYLRAFYNGQVHPYIFHMSWTKNKDNKLKFLQQMGEWYLQEACVNQKVSDLNFENAVIQPDGEQQEQQHNAKNDSTSYLDHCCSAKPIIKCHYRDKPSIVSCKDSPAIDGKGSWWKDDQ